MTKMKHYGAADTNTLPPSQETLSGASTQSAPDSQSSANATEPKRVQILAEASRLTGGDRNKSYGDPGVNMMIAGELKALVAQHIKLHSQRHINAAEREALDLVLTKISRIICGQFKEDNYVDAAAYIAIACEVAQRPRAEKIAQGGEHPDYPDAPWANRQEPSAKEIWDKYTKASVRMKDKEFRSHPYPAGIGMTDKYQQDESLGEKYLASVNPDWPRPERLAEMRAQSLDRMVPRMPDVHRGSPVKEQCGNCIDYSAVHHRCLISQRQREHDHECDIPNGFRERK